VVLTERVTPAAQVGIQIHTPWCLASRQVPSSLERLSDALDLPRLQSRSCWMALNALAQVIGDNRHDDT